MGKLSLELVIAGLPSKSLNECLDVLVSLLQDIQASLSSGYRRDSILRNRLLNAVRDFEQCRLGRHRPADAFHDVVFDHHSSLSQLPQLLVCLSRWQRLSQTHFSLAANIFLAMATADQVLPRTIDKGEIKSLFLYAERRMLANSSQYKRAFACIEKWSVNSSVCHRVFF